jgi:hypothetical protein
VKATTDLLVDARDKPLLGEDDVPMLYGQVSHVRDQVQHRRAKVPKSPLGEGREAMRFPLVLPVLCPRTTTPLVGSFFVSESAALVLLYFFLNYSLYFSFNYLHTPPSA